jgi:hypothetical protein
MSQPRKLGDIMKEYLLESNDDFAKAFRRLYKEHGSNFLEDEPEKEDDHD